MQSFLARALQSSEIFMAGVVARRALSSTVESMNTIHNAARRNLLQSPVSHIPQLALLATGARGSTLDQYLGFFSKTFGRNSAAGAVDFAATITKAVLKAQGGVDGPHVVLSSKLWADNLAALNPSFKEFAMSAYYSDTQHMDFQNKPQEARVQINSWIEKATSNLFKSLLEPSSVDNHTRLVITNALYFKGTWDEPFEESLTKKHEFILLDGCPVQLPMMRSSKPQLFASRDRLRVYKLPYKQEKSQYCLNLFHMDDEESDDDWWNKTAKLFSDPEFLKHQLPTEKVCVKEFGVPKIRTSYEFDGASTFGNRGVVLPFTPAADLSGILVDQSPLFISNMHQKTFVELNEEGTTAGVVTTTFLSTPSAEPVERPYSVADHPFVFRIDEERSGVILFMGHFLNPY